MSALERRITKLEAAVMPRPFRGVHIFGDPIGGTAEDWQRHREQIEAAQNAGYFVIVLKALKPLREAA